MGPSSLAQEHGRIQEVLEFVQIPAGLIVYRSLRGENLLRMLRRWCTAAKGEVSRSIIVIASNDYEGYVRIEQWRVIVLVHS